MPLRARVHTGCSQGCLFLHCQLPPWYSAHYLGRNGMQHGVRSVRLLSAVHACQGMDAELLCRASGGASRCVCVTSLGKLLLASPK